MVFFLRFGFINEYGAIQNNSVYRLIPFHIWIAQEKFFSYSWILLEYKRNLTYKYSNENEKPFPFQGTNTVRRFHSKNV
ncbi:hypothetical protein EGT74_00350 [Chitinophaga lutea]|uniref:Uncharacterized protein n=1 Tax=Chitinophaga lutea TaxID=2488634 RepID=A0A3N4PTS5_9BACT|nr:hypothetical protein EGT74_00350 [Chitinophaga lutea]